MKKNYKIEVDCANCAQKMEDAANTVAGVASATVSFMTQKMKVEFAEPARRARTTARSLISETKNRMETAPLWGSRFHPRAFLLWKESAVFNSFHRVFNTFCGKSQK